MAENEGRVVAICRMISCKRREFVANHRVTAGFRGDLEERAYQTGYFPKSRFLHPAVWGKSHGLAGRTAVAGPAAQHVGEVAWLLTVTTWTRRNKNGQMRRVGMTRWFERTGR